MPLIDMGWKRTKLNFFALHNKKIEAGLLNNTDNMATIGFYQEFGTIHIPERPWLRTVLRHKHENYQRQIAHRIRAMIRGTLAPITLLEQIGKMYEDDIKKSIINWTSPPNAESTIKIKGFNDPLVNSGLMWILVKHKLI